MASSNPWTYLSLKASSEWEIPTPLPRQTNPSSKLPPAPFVLLQTKRQREEELRALSPKAPSTLLTSCSSSPLQIEGSFPLQLFPLSPEGHRSKGRQLQLSAEKVTCSLLASWGTMSIPLRKADIISSAWHLHSALEHSYVNVQQSELLFKSCKPVQSHEGNTSWWHSSI